MLTRLNPTWLGIAATLALALTSAGAVRAADVTSSTTIARSALVLNRSTNTFDSTLTVTNTGPVPLLATIRVVAVTTPAQVTLSNKSGTTPAGQAYLDIAVPNGALSQGQSVRTIAKFSNLSRVQFSVAYAVIGNPDATVNLPVDPGAPGTASLQGVDADSDGVRDDIQRYIAITYRDSERARLALQDYGKVVQQSLDVPANNRTAARAAADQLNRKQECLFYLFGVTQAGRMRMGLFAEYMNTLERWRAYSRFDDQLAGESFRALRDLSGTCAFDLSKTIN